VVDKAAAQMKARADVKKWRVTVAVVRGKFEKVSQRLAEGQAKAVKALLARKGIPAGAIETVGIVADAPLVSITPTEGPATEEPVIEIEPTP